jgi:hypothetical protein
MQVEIEAQQKFQGTEFIFRVEGIGTEIKGRITETLDDTNKTPFYWEISHYYSPSLGGHIHPADVRDCRTFHEAYELMTGYLANMREPLQENDRY